MQHPNDPQASSSGVTGIRPARRRRWLRRLALCVLATAMLIAALLTGAFYYYTDSDRLCVYLRSALSKTLGGEIHLDRVALHWPLSVEVSNLRLDVPRPSDSERPSSRATIFSVPKAWVSLSSSALLSGVVRPEKVLVESLRIPTDAASLEALRDWAQALPHDADGDGADLPEVEAPDVTLVLPDGEDVRLGIRAGADPNDDSVYAVHLRAIDDDEDRCVVRVEASRGRPRSIQWNTPWIPSATLRSLVEAWAPDSDVRAGVERACNELGLSGRVRVADAQVTWASDDTLVPRARVDLELDTLSLPVSEADENRPALQRYVVLHNVRGCASLTSLGVTVDAEATFETAPARLHADLTPAGVDTAGWREAGVVATVRIDGLTLPCDDADSAPREFAFIHDNPAIERFYDHYSPEGRVDAEFILTRAPGPGGALDIPLLRVTALDCRAKYHRFPFGATNVTGVVECNPLGIFLHNLTGRHDDGTITVNAWTEDMSAPAATRVIVQGRYIALDDDLRDALPASYRNVWDEFHPGGLADITAFIERPGRQNERVNDWTMRIDADLVNATVAYDVFPYALADVNGRITITDDAFFIDNVLASHGNARLIVDGRVEQQQRLLTDLDLHIEARDVAADDDLLTALPTRMREALASMTPSGRFHASAAVFRDPSDGRIRYDIDAFPRDLRVRPNAAPLSVEQLTGRIRFTDDLIELDHVEGRHDDAYIGIDGSHRLSSDGNVSSLNVTCAGLSLTPEVCQALPAEARAVLDRWKISGPMCIASHIRSQPGAPADTTHVLTLSDARIQYGDCASALTHASGRIVVTNGRLSSLELQGGIGEPGGPSSPGGGLAIRLERQPAGAGEECYAGALHLDDVPLNDPVVELLPPGIERRLRDLRISGRISADVPHFEYHVVPGQFPSLQLSGQVRFTHLFAPAALGLADAEGAIRFSAEINAIPGWCALSGDVRVEGATLLERRFGATTARWSFQSAPDQGWSKLAFSDIEASAYQGAIMGEAAVTTSRERTSYETFFSAVHLRLADVLADVPGAKSASAQADVGGWLDGQMTLSGDMNRTLDRRGGGRIMVRDARLYRLPILLSVLQVLSLTVPDDALEEASASFTIKGPTLWLDPVVVRGPAISLAGTGALSWSDRTLDLSLVARSPHDWARVPVLSELVEGAAREIVEVRVTGPINHPQVKAGPLRSLRQMMDKLLPEVAEGERR